MSVDACHSAGEVKPYRRSAFVVGVLATGVAMSSAAAQGLFRDTTPLAITITTNLKALISERDSTRVVRHGAALQYQLGATPARLVAATLKPRGHFRRQARNCRFPPLKLEFAARASRGTLFQGNTDLKITTNCRPGDVEFEQYVLAEYVMYRVYQVVSPRHYRTRLARLTYRDSARAMPDVASWGFLVEDDREVAKHTNAKRADERGARFADLDAGQLAATALFEFMIANTDWSVGGLHNISLVRDTSAQIFPIAYDFDWSGAVNPRYAFPDGRLGIRTVTQRLYRGPCLTVREWQPVMARFIAARPDINAIVDHTPALTARRRQAIAEFFAEFYNMLGNERMVRQQLIDTCLSDGN
jgi:hypothetical protein